MSLSEEKLSSLLGLEFKSKLEYNSINCSHIGCDVGFSFI